MKGVEKIRPTKEEIRDNLLAEGERGVNTDKQTDRGIDSWRQSMSQLIAMRVATTSLLHDDDLKSSGEINASVSLVLEPNKYVW